MEGQADAVLFTNRTTQVTYDGTTYYEIRTYNSETKTVRLSVTGVVCNSLPSGYEYREQNDYPMTEIFQV
jgi:hypothetical protein